MTGIEDFFAGKGFSSLSGAGAEAVHEFWERLGQDRKQKKFNPVGNLHKPVVTAEFPGCPTDLPINWLLLPERTMDYCLIKIEPGNGFPEHVHGYGEEFYLVISGGGLVRLDGNLHEAGQHDIFHIQPGVPHELFNPADGDTALELFAVNTPAVHQDLRSSHWGRPTGRPPSASQKRNELGKIEEPPSS